MTDTKFERQNFWEMAKNSGVYRFKEEAELQERYKQIKKDSTHGHDLDGFVKSLPEQGLDTFCCIHSGKTVYIKVEPSDAVASGYVVKTILYHNADSFTFSIGSFPQSTIFYGKPIHKRVWEAVMQQVIDRMLRDKA